MTPTPQARQPWLHEQSVIVRGNATVLSGADGDLTPGTAHGLYVDDERVLSRLELTLAGERPSLVGSGALGDRARFFAAARGLGDRGADPTVEVHRERTLREGGLDELVRVTSRASATVEATLAFTIGCDAVEIGAVKAGRLCDAPVRPELDGDRVRFATRRHLATLHHSVPPTHTEATDDHVVQSHDLTLAPGQSWEVLVAVEVERTDASLFDADPGADGVDWTGVAVRADDPRLGRLVDTSLTDLRQLLQRDPLEPDDVFAAAGSPWYLTLFGRDSLLTARMLLPFGTDLAGGTLRALARRQGTREDPEGAEQPGKIPHEARRTAYDSTALGEALHLPPLYYGTVDATALWVSLLVEAWRFGLPEERVRALLPHLRAALEWLTGDGQPDDDGLLKYLDTTGHGLANQGWKDSGDSMRFRDGTIAEGPIALVEAQAYAVEALFAAADLLDALGETGAGACRAEAEALAGRLRARFWVGADGDRYLAMALDRGGAPVDAVGSNMGHALGTGALTPDEVTLVAATLTGPDLLDGFGVRTLARGTGGYNPIGYHTGSIWTHDTAIVALGLSREGRSREAALVARTLVDSGEAFDYRWPELYSGEPLLGRPMPYPASCRPQAWSAASAGALLTVALGLRADVPAGVLHLDPPRPGPFGALRVEGLRWAGAPFAVAVDRSGSVTVEGLPKSVSVVCST